MSELRENEQRTLLALKELNGIAFVDKVTEISHLAHAKYVSVALGWLNRKNWGEIKKGELIATEKASEGYDERLLSLLTQKKVLIAEELDQDYKKTIETLNKRNLLQIEEKTLRELELTENGWARIKKGIIIQEEISQLTPELIRTGNWRNIKLRKFDVTAPGPTTYPGKIHPVQEIIQQVKEIFLEMGFTEIRGEMIETAFWNFDALFQPQDHPARDMVDTFYLSQPNQGMKMAGLLAHVGGNTNGAKKKPRDLFLEHIRQPQLFVT
ncbi:MAG: hypothetical protein P8X97_02090 [Candidatus Bathyarchaeota archaeon]